jgi:DNA repair protein RadC
MPNLTSTRLYTIPGFRIELVREPGVKLTERPRLQHAAACAPILAQYIGETDREVFVAALLTIRHRLLGLHTVSVGCLTGALVIAHNHPSGDPEPSAEDVALTRRLTAAGVLLGIEVLDHIILGEAGRFVSLRERGVS